jgi:hypothetical protein
MQTRTAAKAVAERSSLGLRIMTEVVLKVAVLLMEIMAILPQTLVVVVRIRVVLMTLAVLTLAVLTLAVWKQVR